MITVIVVCAQYSMVYWSRTVGVGAGNFDCNVLSLEVIIANLCPLLCVSRVMLSLLLQ